MRSGDELGLTCSAARVAALEAVGEIAMNRRETLAILGSCLCSSPVLGATSSAGQAREQLRVELGKGFDLTATQRHFVVAFPSGQKDFWSPRFEEIYNAFYMYFNVRGIKLSEPTEPLVVIVFPTQKDFQRYALADKVTGASNMLGYYSPRTNRVAMYDVGNGSKSDDAWAANSETLIHELAHQIAFNTGVHHRNVLAPRWLCEGLGTLFEARGVWKSRDYKQQKDRLNVGRLRDYQRFAVKGSEGVLLPLIESDKVFESNASLAYAYAWALTFWLTETQPRKYSDYLQLTARRPAGANYSKAERLRDFSGVFGADMKMFETRFVRYLKDVKG
jgi:hypothetical protein